MPTTSTGSNCTFAEFNLLPVSVTNGSYASVGVAVWRFNVECATSGRGHILLEVLAGDLELSVARRCNTLLLIG